MGDVEFYLPRPPFAFRALNIDTDLIEIATEWLKKRLFPGCLEDMIILDVAASRREFAIILLPRAVVSLPKKIELQFWSQAHSESEIIQRLHLSSEDLARR